MRKQKKRIATREDLSVNVMFGLIKFNCKQITTGTIIVLVLLLLPVIISIIKFNPDHPASAAPQSMTKWYKHYFPD